MRPRLEDARFQALEAVRVSRLAQGRAAQSPLVRFVVREWCRQGDVWVSARWGMYEALTAFAACHEAAKAWHLSFDAWAGESPTSILRVGATFHEAR